MPNPEIEELIAQKLREGFVHPGNEANDYQPTPILLPFKNSAGMPDEYAKLLNATATNLSECIVALIEGEGGCEIVPKGEARTLRRAAGDKMPTMMKVYCRCDQKRNDPLMILSVSDPENVVIDGPTLIRGLNRREAKHPHAVIKDA